MAKSNETNTRLVGTDGAVWEYTLGQLPPLSLILDDSDESATAQAALDETGIPYRLELNVDVQQDYSAPVLTVHHDELRPKRAGAKPEVFSGATGIAFYFMSHLVQVELVSEAA